MKIRLISSLLMIAGALSLQAQDVVVRFDNWFKSPIRDSRSGFPDSLVLSSDIDEIVFPDLNSFTRLGEYNFPKLRKVTFENVDYLPGGSFMNMPELEEIVFNGLVGHIDTSFALHCPKLKSIIFKGPLSSIGGSCFAYDCPILDTMVFDDVVVDFDLAKHPDDKCPLLTVYQNNGAFVHINVDSVATEATVQQFRDDARLLASLHRLADWQVEVLTATDPGFMRTEYFTAKYMLPLLEQLGSDRATKLKEAMDYAYANDDRVKTKLEILKETGPYKSQPDSVIQWSFDYLMTDSLLELSRDRFNLDSIAGNGSDVSKMMNLLYWVHDNITHDGSSSIPDCGLNLRDLYDICKAENRGINCRLLAMCLTEALLSQGIPARYLTCQPKAWDSDGDCHVICAAWSDSLGKWIWLDPTFAAYVTDENGLLLHPGEVRYRLINDLPLVLNEDANWNHRSIQTKASYLDNYMAKNLYFISANTLNRPQPEGRGKHKKGGQVLLMPEGSRSPSSKYFTTDDTRFWASPKL